MTPLTAPLVLGIESSCDEMAAAVVRGRDILASVVHAQVDVHAPYGGVVPELASRDHARFVSQVASEALRRANVTPAQLDGVAVTAGPGLVGSLLVGLCFGKALAARHGLPLVGVHHVAGHLASAELADERLEAPYLGLVVSGGHTALYRIEADAAPALLGETRDDAVGEAFDKVAKLLGLPFPGGPAVAREAEGGRRARHHVPASDAPRTPLRFLVQRLEDRGRDRSGEAPRRGSADAARRSRISRLRSRLRRPTCSSRRRVARWRARDSAASRWSAASRPINGCAARSRPPRGSDGFLAVFPPLSLCTDNAAMIAAAGARRLARGERDDASLGAFARAPVDPRAAQSGSGRA